MVEIQRIHERPPTPHEDLFRLREAGTIQWMRKGAALWVESSHDDNVDRVYGSGMVKRLTDFHAQAANAVPTAAATLIDIVKGASPDAVDRINEIRTRLTGSPPTTSQEPVDTEKHPYLTTTEIAREQTDPDNPNDDPLYLLKINDGAVSTDIAFLAKLRERIATTMPASAEAAGKAIDALIGQLNMYRFQDPKPAIKEQSHMEKGGRTFMDEAGMSMGRTAIIAACAAIATIFGTANLVQFLRGKEGLSLAGPLWAFMAFLAYDSSIITNLFDSNDPILRDFENAGTLTSNPTVNALAKKYGIGGKAWKRAVEQIYQGNHGNLHTVDAPSDKAIDDVVPKLANGDARVEKGLRDMFMARDAGGNNDFGKFVRALEAVQGEQAREFVATYIGEDSFRQGPRILGVDERLAFERAAQARKAATA